MLNLGYVLIEKLTEDELGWLCDMYDLGGLDEIFEMVLLPQDKENRPEEYVDAQKGEENE